MDPLWRRYSSPTGTSYVLVGHRVCLLRSSLLWDRIWTSSGRVPAVADPIRAPNRILADNTPDIMSVIGKSLLIELSARAMAPMKLIL
jgi:hypothetical protein